MTLEDISGQIRDLVVLMGERFNGMNAWFDKVQERLDEIDGNRRNSERELDLDVIEIEKAAFGDIAKEMPIEAAGEGDV